METKTIEIEITKFSKVNIELLCDAISGVTPDFRVVNKNRCDWCGCMQELSKQDASGAGIVNICSPCTALLVEYSKSTPKTIKVPPKRFDIGNLVKVDGIEYKVIKVDYHEKFDICTLEEIKT